MRRLEDSRRIGGDAALAAVTFDFTHTLVHSPRLAEIHRQVLRRHGLVARRRDLEREIPWVWKELSCLADPRRDRFTSDPRGARGWWHRFLRRLCQRLELAPPTPFAAAELYGRFTRADAWEVYADVIPTLDALRASGLRLGLVSNWDHRLPRLLENLDLDRRFDAVVYSSACGVEKPHPHIFRCCLERLGVEAGRALHVGDATLEDVEGAMAVGMRGLRIDRKARGSDLRRLIGPFLEGGLPAPCETPSAGGEASA